jgi:hypothetical protein
MERALNRFGKSIKGNAIMAARETDNKGRGATVAGLFSTEPLR